MELHDIFPAVEIIEYSFYYLIMGIILALLLFYFIFKTIKRGKRKKIPYYLNILEHCNLNDSKQTAHKFTYYGKYIVKNETQINILEDIDHTLLAFKYEKYSSSLPKNIQNNIKDFLQMIRKENV